MGAFRRYSKTYVLADGLSTNFGTEVQFPIRERNAWLAGIDVFCLIKLGAALASQTADGLLGVVNHINLAVDEGSGGNRNVVSANGAALVDFARQVTGFVDRTTSASVGAAGTTGTILGVNVPLLFGNPLVTQPAFYSLCLPLPRYGTDPVLRIKLGATADIAATCTLDGTWKGVKVLARFDFVEVIDPKNDFPAIRQQIVTHHDKWTWGATGRRAIDDVTQDGILLGLLQQDYTVAGGRAFCLSDVYGGDDYTVEYRGRIVRQEVPLALQVVNDSSAVYATGAYQAPATLYYDFAADRTLTDTFAFFSGLDLNSRTLQGGKLRLIASNIGVSTSTSRITSWKLLESADKINAVMA